MGDPIKIDKTATSSSIPTREFMITTAVNFLQNPKVAASSMAHKKAFLVKKGLTSEEIDIAIGRAVMTSQQVSNQVLLPVPEHEMVKVSIWSQIHRYGSTVVILGVAIYGIHQFYKMYIEPFLYGHKRKHDRISLMEEQLLEVNRSLSQLRRSVASIEESLGLQKEQLNKYANENLSFEMCTIHSVVTSIKSDISTVKSLLLNRKQFPNVPKLNPTIPTWQMIGGSDKKNEKEIEDDEEEHNEKPTASAAEKLEESNGSFEKLEFDSNHNSPESPESDHAAYHQHKIEK